MNENSVKKFLKHAVRPAIIEKNFQRQVQRTSVIKDKRLPMVIVLLYKRITGRKILKDVTKRHFRKQILQWIKAKARDKIFFFAAVNCVFKIGPKSFVHRCYKFFLSKRLCIQLHP